METNADLFESIPLAQILAAKALPADIYLKIGRKFIKYTPKGEAISASKYNLFMNRNVQFLYVNKEDKTVFIDWLEKSKTKQIDGMINSVGEEQRPVVEKSKEMEGRVFQTFAKKSLTIEDIDLLQEETTEFIDLIKKNKTSTEAMANLTQFNEGLAGHSINVANLSTFLALVMGQGHQLVLENVYLGALFHDYGKTKIDPLILEEEEGEEYEKAINDHPQEGARLVREFKKFPTPVYNIIEQHEEQFDGSGYPKGLQGDEIYNLAKIVGFANTFVNLMSENKEFYDAEYGKDEDEDEGEDEEDEYEEEEEEVSYETIYLEVLKAIKTADEGEFDPKIIEKAIPALEKALVLKKALIIE